MTTQLPPDVDLCALPAAIPPNGTFNLVNPTTLEGAVIAMSVVMLSWAAAFGLVRLLNNARRLRAADCM